MRFWRNTTRRLAGAGPVGDAAERHAGLRVGRRIWTTAPPAGLIRLSDDHSGGEPMRCRTSARATAPDTVNHALTLYRHTSGALVFGAGTVQWSWGLDAYARPGRHAERRRACSRPRSTCSPTWARSRRTLQSGLVRPRRSIDSTAPTVDDRFPGGRRDAGRRHWRDHQRHGRDAGGGVGGVEVSVDGGATWRRANGRETWTFTWTPAAPGA